ncbi:MAG: hypothetical protein Q9221_004413 [Calogaya cf. arnoldii]
MDELEAKRQELLATFDWVGLEKMKPVKMNFANAEDRDLIGKRRIVKGDHAAGNPNGHQRRRPLANAQDKFNMMRATSQSFSSPGKISIHIGSSHRASPAGRRQGKTSNGDDDSRAVTSDEMLLDDKESLRGSTNTLDDMLFGSGSSERASQMNVEPIATDRLLYRQASHFNTQTSSYERHLSKASMFGSCSESDFSSEVEKVEEVADEHRAKSTESAHIRDPVESAVLSSLDPGQLNSNEGPVSTYSHFPEPSRHGESLSEAEYRAPLKDDRNPRNRQMIQSPSRPSNAYKDHSRPAETKLLHDFKPSPPARTTGEISDNIQKHKLLDAQDKKTTSNRSCKDSSKTQSAEIGQQSLDQTADVARNPTPHSPRPSYQDISVNIGASAASATPLSPALQVRSPISGQANEQQAQADPAPEEDELLWRKFVFGTEDPANDWTLEEAPIISKPHRTTDSSSPLQPIFDAANDDNPNSDSPNTHTQTQPSLLVEASSSPSPPPNEGQGVYANNNNSQSPFSPSPPETQHSIQAQVSTSPLQFSSTSSDPLSYSPSRLLQPPVTFRKPNRYLGESQDSVTPVRLGVRKKMKRRRGVDGEDDGTYGERESQRRKKGRREWAGGEVEEMDAGAGEGDEIVDDRCFIKGKRYA